MLGFSSELRKFWKYGSPYLAVIANSSSQFGMVPVELRRDVVRRDREREHAALGVARRHHLDVRAVDHVHLGLQVAVGERHFLAGDHRNLLAQILRAHPVEREVRERRLRAPARRHVEVVDQLLDALLDRVVAHRVAADERRHVGVERRERLRARPFVLQRAEEVHDLADGARHVLRRAGLDLAGHAVQALVQQLAQRPAGAVAGEHVEVVDVDVAFAVRAPDLRRVDVGQPVVGDDLARDVEDQAAQRIALVGVGVDAPVLLLEVFVDRRGDVDQRLAIGAQPRVAVAVDDVGARGVEVAGGRERLLDGVLHLLDVGRAGLEPVREHTADRVGQPVRLGDVEFAGRGAGAGDRRRDLRELEFRVRAVALDHARRQYGGGGRTGSRRRRDGDRFERHGFLLRAVVRRKRRASR